MDRVPTYDLVHEGGQHVAIRRVLGGLYVKVEDVVTILNSVLDPAGVRITVDTPTTSDLEMKLASALKRIEALTRLVDERQAGARAPRQEGR